MSIKCDDVVKATFEKEKPIKFTVCMPDGFVITVPIYKEESGKGKVNSIVNNWYKLTKDNPKKFNHFDIKDKCPKCGGPMRCKILSNSAAIWCLDHNCGYRNIEESPKVRDRIYEKYGLKTRKVNKTGCFIMLSNRPTCNKK